MQARRRDYAIGTPTMNAKRLKDWYFERPRWLCGWIWLFGDADGLRLWLVELFFFAAPSAIAIVIRWVARRAAMIGLVPDGATFGTGTGQRM